jgi:uroporphyrinogen decarboxylase
MTSKERVKKAIYFSRPDHIPHYLSDGKENDIIWVWVPRPPFQKNWHHEGSHESCTDEWGVTWHRAVGNAGFGEAKHFPIKNISEHQKYKFPDLNNPIYMQDVVKQLNENSASKNPKYVLGVLPFNSLNEGIHNLIGLEQMMLSYYENPEALKSLISRFANAQQESIKLLAQFRFDGIMAYDDWGVQDRLLISREMILDFFMPHYQNNWNLAHELGMDVWMHSCGHIAGVLNDFISAGLNVIQMDQQEHIGLDKLNKDFGGRIAFWCPVDVQKTMVTGSLEYIRKYVKKMVETLGSHQGGLISMCYSSPEAVGHTQENTEAMCQVFRLYGIYH